MFSKYRIKKSVVKEIEIRKEVHARESKNALFGVDVFKQFTKINTENIPTAIEILKELYPQYKFQSNKLTSNLIRREFECECSEEQVKEARKYDISPEEEEIRNMYKHCLE
jgi:hypothetical protein